MNLLKSRLNRLMLFLALAALLQGCSTLWGPKPDIVSEEKEPGRTFSSAETRRILIDQPNLLSGDYFRERSDKETPDSVFRSEGSMQSPAVDASEGLKTEWSKKIGLLIDSPLISGKPAEALVTEAARALPQGLVLVGPARLQEVLASAGCETDMDCVAREASVYPGVRILIIAEALQLPESFPGKAGIQLKMIDADLLYVYPVVELTATVGNLAETDAFLFHAFRRAFADVQRYADIMPPHARVFSVKGDRIYISAGKVTGMAPSDVFPVVSGGETVYAPSGVPVGWVPGEPKGAVQVDLLVGEDAAGCTLVEGEMPVTGDYVILQQQAKNK